MIYAIAAFITLAVGAFMILGAVGKEDVGLIISAAGIIISGLFIAGMASAVTALRDIARNSWHLTKTPKVVAKTATHVATGRQKERCAAASLYVRVSGAGRSAGLGWLADSGWHHHSSVFPKIIPKNAQTNSPFPQNHRSKDGCFSPLAVRLLCGIFWVKLGVLR